jgi:hypothetical protein
MSRIKSPPPPKLTHAPWAGYTAHEHKREAALARCPSARCARVKECVAAYEGLYCQRTHISHAEHISANPPAPRHEINDLDWRREFLIDQIEQRKARQHEMQSRWRLGAFDQLYGKYNRHGILLPPPPRIYEEGR